VLSIAAFLGVVLLGVLPGIAIAVALSILNVFRRAWWPYETRLGRVKGIEGYHDVHSYPQAQHLPGLVIYRFDAPLFFPTMGTAVAAFRARTGAQWTPAHPASADGTAPGQSVAGDTAPPDPPTAPSGPQGHSS